jgi:hypothetical protein
MQNACADMQTHAVFYLILKKDDAAIFQVHVKDYFSPADKHRENFLGKMLNCDGGSKLT